MSADPRLALKHQSRRQQILHDAADGAARQSDLPRQVDARRVLLPQQPEQQQAVLDAHCGHVENIKVHTGSRRGEAN